MNSRRALFVRALPCLVASLVLAPTLAAQGVSPAPAGSAAPAANSQEVVELSPFTVNTDRDIGYAAENTLGGSRLNTPLRDTAQSISVFTKEFLDDLAITDIRELVQYSVNSEMNTNENQATSNGAQNPVVNAESLTQKVLNRGLATSLGMDYFTSITPTDPYRAGRYEDSRGPNSILFGVGAPGGIINQSSKVALLGRNTATLRWSGGSWGRNRSEFDANKVLRKDTLAVSLAGLHQENGGWRAFDFQDKQRIFGSVVVRPHRQVKLTAMGEIGRDIGAVIRNTVDTDEVLAWYDNREARGTSAVTFVPNNTVPTAAMIALGVVAREGNRTGQNRRAIYVENDGTIFDAIGTFLSGSYNNSAVRAPDGTPGVTATNLRIRDSRLIPDNINAAGPGMQREQTLRNYTLIADWQPTRNLSLNLAHNYQYSRAKVTLMTGTDPTLRGEPNRNYGVTGPANPYAGRLYYDGNWRRDIHTGEVWETRLAASYNLDTKSKWFGRHRIAAMASMSEQFDTRANSWLALAGRPYNAVPNNINNRITVRNYIDEGSWATYRVGDWRSLPTQFNFDGRSFTSVWANEVGGPNNSGGEQEATSLLGVVQSHFFENKLVTTLGYRQDEVDVWELGFRDDPLVGDVVVKDRSLATLTSATGYTATAGIVYHVLPWLSVIGNRSTNQGTPSFVRKVFPDGNLAPPTKGTGQDIGLGFDLLDGRVSARAVYFTSVEEGRIDQSGFVGSAARNTRVMDAFAGVLVGAGRPIAASQWDATYRQYTPPATSVASDWEAEGYEARIVANLTRNWRLVANYSYTDSSRTNLATELMAWYGLKTEDGGRRVVQGVTQNAAGQFVMSPSAFEAGGTVAKWIELGAMTPDANPSVLATANGQTVAQEVFTLVNSLNDVKEQEEKRWGVRPHKVSLFTAYDFREGRLKGFTVGGGWRWRSANVIGANSAGGEITGRVITANDVMLGYTRKFDRVPGRFRFQLNISNVLDNTKIIPVRIASGVAAPDGFNVPDGRGVGYSRYDLVAPRELRFTTTWSY